MSADKIGADEVNFPQKLKSQLIKPLVKELWYRGEWNVELFTKCVAIVGSRRMSRYGRQTIEEIVPRFCHAGYTIISGLMYGVDQLAHQVTLSCGGRAIGVLGYGIERNNEVEADKLVEDIVASGGLILSEYPGDTRGQVWTFPQRNRIVVGLSDLIVVVEAGAKSGSLNTANWAKRMKKPVYALPGSVFSPTSEGTNWLVAEGLAKALTKTELEKLCGEDGVANKVEAKQGKGEVWVLLKIGGAMSVNEVARKARLGAGKVLAQLMQLEMEGLVFEERGMWKLL